MPASAEEGREIMFSWMKAQTPRSVLDVGPGNGTYGRLFRNTFVDPMPYLIGIEVWRPYIGQYHLTDIYDHVLCQDIRRLPMDAWPRADIVVLGDVLEHMTEHDAVRVWSLAMASARKAVYLSIPVVPCPQGTEHGNPYEEHVVPDWTHDRVMESFPGITWQWRGTIVGRYEAVINNG